MVDQKGTKMNAISLDQAVDGFIKLAGMTQHARARFDDVAGANMTAIAASLREQGFNDSEVQEALSVCRDENAAALRDLERKIWTDGLRHLIEKTGVQRITITIDGEQWR